MKDVIYEHQPNAYKAVILKSITLFILPALVFIIIIKAYWTAAIVIVLGPAIAYFLSQFDPETYDGWKIESDKIILLRNGKTEIEQKEIIYSTINKLTYFSGGKNAKPKLTFYINGKKIWLLVNYCSFDLANTFKHFESLGIKVNLINSDAELKLYLDGKVESIPIKNKY
jgi:hypothetical protein